MQLINTLVAEIRSHARFIPNEISHDLPYFSQWESPELVDQILVRAFNTGDDPKWKLSGAKNREEYEFITWHICGLACLKSILVYRGYKNINLVTLFHLAEKYGVYHILEGNHDIRGLYYKPFVLFTLKVFNTETEVAPFLSIKRILYELSQNRVVIASVHPSIRNVNSPNPSLKGGHLVLVTGYNKVAKTLTLHNPSGYYNISQNNVIVSFSNFKRFFANRGIIINI
jgi:hypothetical protein